MSDEYYLYNKTSIQQNIPVEHVRYHSIQAGIGYPKESQVANLKVCDHFPPDSTVGH